MKKKKTTIPGIIKWVIAIILVVMQVYPFFYVFTSSFRRSSQPLLALRPPCCLRIGLVNRPFGVSLYRKFFYLRLSVRI